MREARARPLITLTTDFGDRDAYVGAMKGVMLDIEPHVQFVDITHANPAQDVRHAAYVLWSALPYFPERAVHLVVVDPGVGTARRAIASQTSWGRVVGPDNGVFSYVWASASNYCTVALEESRYHRREVSQTFHGRDIFAPAAAHLAAGVDLTDLGPEIEDPVRLPTPKLELEPSGIRGKVLAVDHFGNVVTSIGRFVWAGNDLNLDAVFGDVGALTVRADTSCVVVAGEAIGPVLSTYGGVAPGEKLALIGSTGMLEVAVNQGHAASVLGLDVGDPIKLQFNI